MSYLKDCVLLKDQKRNCIRFRNSEGWAHLKRKTEVCYWLAKKGYEFYTEAEFKTGGRADIVVYAPEEFIVEIVNSEKKESIDVKKEFYPTSDIRVISARQRFNYLDIL